MANVKKFGEAVVITSAAKLEDIRKIAKYRPEALILRDENDEPLFGICVSANRRGEISPFGIEFGGCDGNGFAQMTAAYAGPAGDDDAVKAAIADSIGAQVAMLTKLEESFPALIEEIDAEVAAILASIEIG